MKLKIFINLWKIQGKKCFIIIFQTLKLLIRVPKNIKLHFERTPKIEKKEATMFNHLYVNQKGIFYNSYAAPWSFKIDPPLVYNRICDRLNLTVILRSCAFISKQSILFLFKRIQQLKCSWWYCRTGVSFDVRYNL